MNAITPIRFLDHSHRKEMAKVNDVYLSARALQEAAIRYQSIPWYPDCDQARASAKRIYEQAMAEMMEAING